MECVDGLQQWTALPPGEGRDAGRQGWSVRGLPCPGAAGKSCWAIDAIRIGSRGGPHPNLPQGGEGVVRIQEGTINAKRPAPGQARDASAEDFAPTTSINSPQSNKTCPNRQFVPAPPGCSPPTDARSSRTWPSCRYSGRRGRGGRRWLNLRWSWSMLCR